MQTAGPCVLSILLGAVMGFALGFVTSDTSVHVELNREWIKAEQLRNVETRRRLGLPDETCKCKKCDCKGCCCGDNCIAPAKAVVIPQCKCGCMETGHCECKNCCERTADPTWKPAVAGGGCKCKFLPACNCGKGADCDCVELRNLARKGRDD